MKATELRIGNLITANFGMGYEQQETVDADTFDRFDSDHVTFDAIPLTEEWLLKFGFTVGRESDLDLPPLKFYRKEEHYNGKTAHLFVSDYGDDSHYDIPLPHIKYIHQLQNLYYSLTGEELTLK